MKYLFAFLILSSAQAHADWRTSLLDYAKIHVRHQSWGYTHAQRNYEVSLRIAEKNISLSMKKSFSPPLISMTLEDFRNLNFRAWITE